MAGVSSTKLSRELGAFAVFSLNAGTMIGAGIFVLPGPAVKLAGPAALLAFLMGGVVALASAISVSELATGMPKSGGSYYFLSRVFGPVVGSIIGWGSYFGLVFKGAFALEGFGDYLLALTAELLPGMAMRSLFDFAFVSGVPVPGPVVILGIVVCLGLMLMNAVGADVSGYFQNYIVFGLLVILGLFVLVGATYVQPANYSPFFDGSEDPASGLLAATGLIFVSFLGVVKASAVAEEVRNPSRNLPLGIISSIATITLLYVGVVGVMVGVRPAETIAASPTAIFDVSSVVVGSIGGLLMGTAGVFATLSTGNAALMASSRYPFAMARDNLMNEWLTETSERFGTPVRTIAITGLFMILLIIFSNVETMAKLGGVFLIVILALINLAVIVLRNADPDWYDPGFQSPLYPWVQLAGIVGTLLLILKMGLVAQVGAGIFLLWGIAWAWFYRDEDLKPGFNFFDILRQVDHTVALKQVEEELEEPRQNEIVIGVANLDHVRPLIRLAAAVSKDEQEVVHLVHPNEVPAHKRLGHYGPGFPRFDTDSIENTIPAEEIEELETFTGDLGMEFKFSELLTRDAGKGLVSFCRENPVDLLLLDWHKDYARTTFHNSHVYYAAKKAPCDVAVLRDRGMTDIGKILLSTRIGPYDELEVRLARGLAEVFDADLTLHHVASPDQGEDKIQEKRKYLEELAELGKNDIDIVIERSENPVPTIVEAARDHDLVLMGISGQVFLRRLAFGNVPELVAQHVDTSVVLARGERAQRQGFFRTIVDRIIYGVPFFSKEE